MQYDNWQYQLNTSPNNHTRSVGPAKTNQRPCSIEGLPERSSRTGLFHVTLKEIVRDDPTGDRSSKDGDSNAPHSPDQNCGNAYPGTQEGIRDTILGQSCDPVICIQSPHLDISCHRKQ